MFQSVTSREYKLILNSDRFQNRDKGCQAFGQLVEFLVAECGGVIEKKQNRTEDEENRRTWYVDTPELALQQNKFVLRIRQEGDIYKTALKYRSSDRYISASKNVDTSTGKTKFEEDITPAFISKFSKSASIETGEPPAFNTVGDIVQLFPGLGALELSGSIPVTTVNNFVANEVFRKAGRIKFADQTPSVKAAFSFWYFPERIGEYPLITEFSFDYDSPNESDENFPVTVVEASNKFFAALQKQSGWINRDNDTKTSYAYESLS